MENKVTFIDLFAGIGGFRYSFEQSGCKCVFSSEIDEACKKVYQENYGDEPYGDITKIGPKDIPNTFIRDENLGNAYKQCGNSVVIPMITEIAESILRQAFTPLLL